MASTTNLYIIDQFDKAAAVLTALNDSFFKIRAYQTAVESIKALDEELSVIYKRTGNLNTIPGLGAELSQKAIELLETGKSRALEKLFAKVPSGMFALLNIPSVGPKRAYKIATLLGLDDQTSAIKTLKSALDQGQLDNVEGFGPKLLANIKDNLNRAKPKTTTRMRIDRAEIIVDKTKAFLSGISGVESIHVLGSLRRGVETIGDVDMAIITSDSRTVIDGIKAKLSELEALDAAGTDAVRLRFPGNYQVDIKFIPKGQAGATLQHFTGSKLHNIALRELALSQGKSLSEWGIKVDKKIQPYNDEVSFYNSLGLDFIPPELRENSGEIEAAKTHTLPKLVELIDIRGDLHTHTDYGWVSSHDYGASVSKLLDIAKQLHYQWLALGDHNPSTREYHSSNLVDLIRNRQNVLEQKISSWKTRVKSTVSVLFTLEVDILSNGDLALSDEALNVLDYAIVSIHSNLAFNTTQQTNRLIKALSHPKVKIIGHPTGRLINERPGMTVDWPVIFKVCAQRNIALEINTNPARLDLPDTLVRQAVQAGCKLALGSDAHHETGLLDLKYGVTTARRGWAQKSDIINTYTYSQLKQWLAK